MCIKGIGLKKAEAIIQYRKLNKLKSADDLLKIKGFGKVLVEKIKKGELNLRCKRGTASKQNNSANKSSKKEETKTDKK